MGMYIETKMKSYIEDFDRYYLDMGITWSLGKCSSAIPYFRPNGYRTYTERCCLEPGPHTLVCSSKYPEGWMGALLEVGKNQYCHDFVGFRALRQLSFEGIKLPTN